MALWQYDIHLLPKSEFVTTLDPASERMDREAFDGHDWWLRFRLTTQLLHRLSGSLAEGKSWSSDIKTWGVEDGNRVDVVLEGGRISDVFVRIDVRDIQLGFLNDIMSIAKDMELVVLTPDLRSVDPNTDELLALIATSGSAKFVEDPEKFLTTSEPQRSPNGNEH